MKKSLCCIIICILVLILSLGGCETDADITEEPIPTKQPVTNMVWVVDKGKKYHNHPGCSNMKEPYQISKDNAIKSGRSACSKCY